MKKKILVILCIATLMITLGTVFALLTTTYNMPQTATPPADLHPLATFTIAGQPWTNGTAISWGQLVLGDNTKSILITNAGPVALNPLGITMVNTGLPAGWTETLVLGTPTGSGIPGTITLHADASVTGVQSWSSVISITA